MSQDEFTKLFKYMQNEFKQIDRRFDDIHQRIDLAINAVDAFAKQSETYMQEMLALGHQVDRHEGWIQKAARPVGVKYSR